MISDRNIHENILAELQWDPDINEHDLRVCVQHGDVQLSGFVANYHQKTRAEADVKRVAGVTGVANEIEIRLPLMDRLPDTEIARDAIMALKVQLPVIYGYIQILVRDGWITLEGNTEWQYLRERVEAAVHHLQGVRGVINNIIVKPKAAPVEIKKKIEDAFKRNVEIDAQHIVVEAHEGDVILKGTVQTWFERKEATRAAWSAPGVRRVEDRIAIRP